MKLLYIGVYLRKNKKKIDGKKVYVRFLVLAPGTARGDSCQLVGIGFKLKGMTYLIPGFLYGNKINLEKMLVWELSKIFELP
jgi:hypothetical protein